MLKNRKYDIKYDRKFENDKNVFGDTFQKHLKFDCIPSLFHLAFGKNEKDMSIEDGTEFIKKKLERDYSKLSEITREEIKDRYENIIKVLFVEK